MTELATPLLRQYNRIKAEYPAYILMFRLGDFYEMFNEDAKIASQVLNIALTRKSVGENRTVPLAGVPYHSVDGYLAKLIKAGYKVAICEQVEDPKKARGIVKREVIRVVTPGTVVEESILEEKSNNFLLALYQSKKRWGMAAVDISTGDFGITEFSGERAEDELFSEICRIHPTELLVPEKFEMIAFQYIDPSLRVTLTKLSDDYFHHASSRALLLEQLNVQGLEGFGAEQYEPGIAAAGAIIRYLRETQKTVVGHINSLKVYSTSDFMILDHTTQRSLELVRNLHSGGTDGTLLNILDYTLTAMGGRLLRQWIVRPLKNKKEIEERLDAIEEMYLNSSRHRALVEQLKGIYDLERIISRVGCRTANARDLQSLKQSLERIPALLALLQECVSPLFTRLLEEIDPLPQLREHLAQALVDNPPLSLREGGLIRDHYDPALDELRAITRDSKGWINRLRKTEVERTGIHNLKIGFNKVFGYYIEITKANLRNLPELPPEYIRKQTLVNAERFITPALKEKEDVILNAEEKINEREYQLFEALREEVAQHTRQIQQLGRIVAILDCIHSLTQAAITGHYSKPEINEADEIRIAEGRHPVLEAVQLDQGFVPNDARLDNRNNQILLITGPNMAGKSTYIRQVALITLMAHMGSFVPAKAASICLVDRIFTRVGAMDYLVKGQSTFLVEMNETANILNNATSKSLVILDEIGRGTSTYDGLSIAWAVIEHLHETEGCMPKTLFATHYHELTDLESVLPRVRNYNVAVLEEQERIAFLYRIVPGGTDRSYGIYAATLAGIPFEAIRRAREILTSLEQGKAITVKTGRQAKSGTGPKEPVVQLSLFDGLTHPVLERLRQMDVSTITPVEAVKILDELIKQSK
jgi:DNA mismatch repair protein MutS